MGATKGGGSRKRPVTVGSKKGGKKETKQSKTYILQDGSEIKKQKGDLSNLVPVVSPAAANAGASAVTADHDDIQFVPPTSPSKRGRSKGHPFSNAAAKWLKGGEGEGLDNQLLRATRWRQEIGDVKCEVFELERDEDAMTDIGARPIRIVIVPGNPGVCAFYVRTAKKVFEALGRRVSVSAVSYAGFPTDALDAKLVSLPEEAVHFASVLNAMHERRPEEEFVLVGHSIGSWLCTEAMKGMPELPVAGAGLVFPFVCVGRDKFRKQNWLDARSWPFILRPFLHTAFFAAGQIGVAFSVLAGWQQRLVLKLFGGGASKDALCSEVTLEYIVSKPHILRSLFYLGKTEMCLLPRPSEGNAAWCDRELGSYETLSHKLHWLYTSGDSWAPLEQAEMVRKQLPKSTVSIDKEGTKHAFCMTDEDDERVAKWVCGLPCFKDLSKRGKM